MSVQGTDRWQDVLAEIRKTLRKQQYDTWFKRVHFVSPGGEQVLLVVPNRFHADWMASNYRATVEEAVQRTLGFRPQVEFAVDASPATDAAVEQPGSAEGRAPEEFGLRGSYQLDTFVVGNCNRLAQAAARSVAECPGAVYNPLFVQGGTGMGKTHLLQALCRRYLQLHPGEEIACVSAQDFVRELVQACQDRTQEAFRAKYRSVSLLAMDDVQLLADRESSQEEFFHVFNELHSQKRQVVVAGDRAPQNLSGFSERLVSRLRWGLIVNLDAPDHETKLAILRSKAAALRLSADDDVFEQLASSISDSIRELEGALLRTHAYASLVRKRVSVALTREALETYGAKAKRPITAAMIQESVAKHFGVTVKDLLSKKRARPIAFPRQVAMYLARCLTNSSFEEIGRDFGGRDHTTALYAAAKISKLKEKDAPLADALNEIAQALSSAQRLAVQA